MSFESTSLWQREKALQRLAGNHATSHAIKGVSGDVGAEALRQKASSIEILSASGDWNEIEVNVSALASVIDATKSEMAAAHA